MQTLPLILMQLKITNIFGSHRVLSLSVKHHNETYLITNTMMKQSKWLHGKKKTEHKNTTKWA